ncbi:fimbrial protein [Siccibacter turicensis]|uniref:fimbrial protein n=1 Tax=Siccibacter turicensis TaxID=357233 RepID=UPI003F56B6BA
MTIKGTGGTQYRFLINGVNVFIVLLVLQGMLKLHHWQRGFRASLTRYRHTTISAFVIISGYKQSRFALLRIHVMYRITSMRKSVLCAMIPALFIMSAAHAEPEDSVMSSTNITVDGAITSGDGSCAVAMNKSSISLLADKTTVVPQSQTKSNSFNGTLSVSLSGDDICNQRIQDGKIAVRFTGPADEVEGNVFANTATGENAAKGVGVGLFLSNRSRIVINQGAIPVRTKPLEMSAQVVGLTGQEIVEGNVQAAITVEIIRL